ncbi:MAG: hypothetical protein JWP81_871 [Ferruginibacter sp.]|nr:hypothetical protein [Ferruginibacter sp.]
MEKNNLLQCFEYTIMPAAFYASMIETEHSLVAQHQPLMRVCIDFEKGKFFLEGAWQFLVASNRHVSSSWFPHHTGRVAVEADIYPSGVIDLDDYNNDGLVCPVEGIINDRNNRSSCTGLIVLDKTWSGKTVPHHIWDITFYLYDYQVDDCEINYKLPVYKTINNDDSN